MNDPIGSTSPGEEDDPVLSGAGSRLREGSTSISPAAVEAAVWRRRTKGMGILAGASLAVMAVFGGVLVMKNDSTPQAETAAPKPGAPSPNEVQKLMASLPDQPVDPTKVQLVSTVSTFDDCGSLMGDLRRVGAEHVGSRGFGGNFYGGDLALTEAGAASADANGMAFDQVGAPAMAAPGDGSTLGTNVQVAGVDELDFVKAVDDLIYDLDGKGNLRITDASELKVLSTLEVTLDAGGDEDNGRFGPRSGMQVSQILVADGRLAIFGTEFETSDPVEGDPSATQAQIQFMTVTFVDASDPAEPTITDRVRIEGSLVSARLVGGDIRLVTTSNMADLGFLMPTTPTSVPKALEQNRLTVATSTAADWVPDWQRKGEDPQPLVPCDRVHVPDTFSGVAMTSMVSLPIGSGRFTPSGTSILAPATTLYAGLDRVAISSEVWVDPIDQQRLEFDDWQTAIHEFSFADGAAPAYDGSGIVDGSTVGQFAFGEIGEALAVVTTQGTPWNQNPDVVVDLTVLTADGAGGLTEASKVADLADGKGAVTAVRFVEGRVLISVGAAGREIHVIDVTDVAEPRRAGAVSVPGSVGYFHPLDDQQALVVGQRYDSVGEGRDKEQRSWVQAHLLDVADADAPKIVSTWEREWSADEVGSDHHAFTYWPDRQLAMWGIQDTKWSRDEVRLNHAVVLSTDGTVGEVAVPVANKPNVVPSPCPTVTITDPDAAEQFGPYDEVVRCDDASTKEIEWPRYSCYPADGELVARYVPEDQRGGAIFICSLAPQPTVSRVLVVAGIPMLFTDQTLETLDPETFESTAIAYHPSGFMFGGW